MTSILKTIGVNNKYICCFHKKHLLEFLTRSLLSPDLIHAGNTLVFPGDFLKHRVPQS